MRMLATLFAAGLVCGHATAACPPAGSSRGELNELREHRWDLPDAGARNALALGLLDCLADPDPVLRDEIAFEALQSWIRGAKLEPATVQTIRGTLLARLQAPDPAGFGQPFAALVLAEVARVDRTKPFLSGAERSALVRAAGSWLTGVRDFRGYDAREGWRHGVAHGADLMLQLSLNPALDKADQMAILEAIASQVRPADRATPHFYIFGEGERLMAPVYYLARRDALNAADWEVWLARITEPAPPPGPQTMALLARRHNLKGFLLPLFASLTESGDAAQRARLLPIVTKALKRLD